MASPSAGAPALKYGDVNTETSSPGEVKGLNRIRNENINFSYYIIFNSIIKFFNDNFYNDCSTDIDYTTISTISENSDNSEISDYNSILRKIKNNITANQYNYIYDMSQIFSNCISLSSLPDISKWNTNNAIDMSGMFSNCSSLSSLPDISKWNTNHSPDMSKMFDNCILLLNIPNLQKNNDKYFFNPFASPSAGAPALKYGYVNTVTTPLARSKG